MTSLLSGRNQSLIPLAPIAPPRLIPVQDSQSLEQFSIDLTGAIPQIQSCKSATNENIMSPVMFLYKFEDVNSRNVSFNWTVSSYVL